MKGPSRPDLSLPSRKSLFRVVGGVGLQFTAKPIAGLFPARLSDPCRMDTTVDQSGDYLGLVLFTGLILFHVISEEVLWRGYALPRQELTHGRDTWWIHGLLWTGFHWFRPWDPIAPLPGASSSALAPCCRRPQPPSPH